MVNFSSIFLNLEKIEPIHYTCSMSKWKKSSQELVDRFYTFTEPLPNIEPKKMFGYPCCFLNGNMFTGLHEENWIVRLPEEDRNELIDNHGATQFAPMEGRVMREYVTLPPTILSNPLELKKWLDKSHAFATTLPPKAKKIKSRSK